MNITIGQNIKKLRSVKHITQKQLASFLGITEQAVSRWESGSGYPDITMLPSIASFFGVSSDTLLGHELLDLLFVVLVELHVVLTHEVVALHA